MKNLKAYLLRSALILLLLLSYNSAQAQSDICITPNLQTVLTTFVDEVDTEGNINEIYANKIDPTTYQVVIYSGSRPMSNDGVPTMSVNYEGVTFFLYSPLEHYFFPCNKEALPNTDSIVGPPNGTYWIVTDKNGVMNVDKNNWVNYYNTLIPLSDETSSLDPDFHFQLSIDPIIAPDAGFGTPPPPPAPAPGFGTPPPAPAPGFGTPPPPPAPAPGFGTPPPPPAPNSGFVPQSTPGRQPNGPSDPQPVVGPNPEPAPGPGL